MNSKNKLIFISHGLNIGGAEKFLISLANSLCLEFNTSILAISPGDALLHELAKEVNYSEIKRNRKFDLKTILSLRKILKENPTSIICTMDFFCFLYYRLASFGLKKSDKVFISYHSTILKNFKENFLTFIYTRFIRKKDMVLTVCNNQAVYTAEKFRIKLNQFYSIYNGVNVEYWKEENSQDIKKQIRTKYNIPLDANLIVITAALREEKNHVLGIRALKYLHEKLNNFSYLLIVGDGTFLNDIKKEVNECKLNEYVIFAGSQNDVKPFYYASNIFTLTSFTETFSIAVLEAMACGLPCVITNVGGANEIISDGFNGFLTEVNDISVAENWNTALNQNFSKNDIQKYVFEKFNLEDMVKKYYTIFQS